MENVAHQLDWRVCSTWDSNHSENVSVSHVQTEWDSRHI